MRRDTNGSTRPRLRRRSLAVALVGLLALTGIAISVPAAAGADQDVVVAPASIWQAAAKPAPAGAQALIQPEWYRTFAIDRAKLEQSLAAAPVEGTAAAERKKLIISLPAPYGGTQSFVLEESSIMEPELAAKHPDIKTYAGRGIDDPAATIRADLTPLGFHASVRSPLGAWYVDPQYHLSESSYISYFARDLEEDPNAASFVERDGADSEAAVEALEETLELADVPEGPLVQLKTYRLGLVTDPGYSDFFGGPANVTPAKVALINRVTQIYEDETAIRLVLIADTDKLNLDTPALATGTNGPCGAAACFTTGQVSSCSNLARIRIVIGQIIGASNYDIGHLALGRPGGGVANLGVVGRSQKAQGCTGLAAPVGDFFAVDYVSHEMGHQFAGNHTFNGTQSNCSGGNRSAANSVEPGSGSSIMAYAGICAADNLQTNSDPYWSQRSYQEVTTYVNSNQAAINEVQTASLVGFDTDGDSFRIRYNGNDSVPIVRGTNYNAAGILAAIQGIPGWPGGTVALANFGSGGSPSDLGFQVTFNSAPLAMTNVTPLELVDFVGASGWVGETDKGGPVDNKGWTITDTGNHAPTVEPLTDYTIPLQTPLALTASASDFDGDAVTYLWEQNDRGAAAGTALQNNTKANGPLFRVFGTPLRRPPYDPTEYEAEGENHPTTNPTRVLPDIQQILDGRTNAVTGACLAADIECFSEFLPTAAYTGFAGVNASPARLNFRVTARDNRGGVGTANTVLFLAAGTGPFLVTSQGDGASVARGQSVAVTWNTAGTNAAPIDTANVKISLSLDGGYTYPHVLTASTPNDGSETLVFPNASTATARIKVEAVGNVFFDLSDANFAALGCGEVRGDGRLSTNAGFDYTLYNVKFENGVVKSNAEISFVDLRNLQAKVKFASTSIDTLLLVGGTATLTGAGVVNGEPVTYSVTAVDGSPDRFSIELSNGYSASGNVTTGRGVTLKPC